MASCTTARFQVRRDGWGRGRVSVNTAKTQNLEMKILEYNHGRLSLRFAKQSWDYSSAQ